MKPPPPSALSEGFHAILLGDALRLRRAIDDGFDVNHQGSKGATALSAAAWRGSSECVQTLLDCGADPNLCSIDGMSPACATAFRGHEPSLRLLLGAGADPNATHDGLSTLAWALSHLDLLGPRCAIALLEAGVDPNVPASDGFSCAGLAARDGSLELLKVFAQRGADLTALDEQGRSCLDLARSHGHLDCADFIQAWLFERELALEIHGPARADPGRFRV